MSAHFKVVFFIILTQNLFMTLAAPGGPIPFQPINCVRVSAWDSPSPSSVSRPWSQSSSCSFGAVRQSAANWAAPRTSRPSRPASSSSSGSSTSWFPLSRPTRSSSPVSKVTSGMVTSSGMNNYNDNRLDWALTRFWQRTDIEVERNFFGSEKKKKKLTKILHNNNNDNK